MNQTLNTKLLQISQKLNNIDYNDLIVYIRDNIDEFRKNKFVIVYGASDDLLEMEGAFDNEYDCISKRKLLWVDNNFIYEHKLKELYDYLNDEFDGLFINSIQNLCKDAKFIEINPKVKNCQFEYTTNIPCEWFNVLLDNELYCKGFIFNIESLQKEN